MTSQAPNRSRRQFLVLLSGGLAAILAAPSRARATGGEHADCASGARPTQSVQHPEPRPDVDASGVLTSDQLAAVDTAPVFDMVREIPHVADGLRCHCGCADLDGYRSLLSCYEGPGMAQFCDICKGEARIAHRLHNSGMALEEIREAVDARYG